MLHSAIAFFGNCFVVLTNLLDSYSFVIFGTSITLLEILITAVLISMAITLYWRGAKG